MTDEPTVEKSQSIIDKLIANVFGKAREGTEHEQKMENVRNHLRFPGDRKNIPCFKRKGLKNAGQPLYKPAVCGMPRTSIRPGAAPAPTHDQVKRLETKFGQRLIVKAGLVHFKDDGHLFTAKEAQRRYESDCHQENHNLPTIEALLTNPLERTAA